MNAATGPRWYCVNNMGMATLCANQADAENVASDCDTEWPRQAPHRAVQLVEVSGCRIGRDEILSMAREAGLLTVTVSKAVGEIRKDRIVNFADLVTATERTARQEAQQRLADAQELLAKSGLAHRKAVQAAVAEAVAAEREACAVVCESMHEEDRPSDYAYAIRARGAA